MWIAMRFVPPLSLVGVSMVALLCTTWLRCVAVLITGEVNLFYYAFVLTAVGACPAPSPVSSPALTFSRAAGALCIKEQAPHILQSNQGVPDELLSVSVLGPNNTLMIPGIIVVIWAQAKVTGA